MASATTIELTIDEQAHSYAKIYSSLLKDEFQRKRAYSSITALYALINLLEKTNNDIQKSMTVFRNPILNEQYEISDLYVNDWHIDVRVVTKGNAFLVPKCHFDNNIVPDFYAVIKVDAKLETAELVGFADTKNMEKQGFDYHYFSVANENLLNYAQFLTAISKTKEVSFSEKNHEIFQANYLSLLDNELDLNIKKQVLKHLFECKECRKDFCCFTGFEMVNQNLCKFPEVFNDETLNIVGAQAAETSKYSGKEETIYIGNEQEQEEKQETNEEPVQAETDSQANQEESVSDILDELFSDDAEPVKQPEQEEQLIEADLDILEQTEDAAPLLEENALIELNEQETLTEELPTQAEEIALIEDTVEEETPVITPVVEENSNVQKVIVDYDEFGEPIYSYITGIGEGAEIEGLSEIESIDDIISDLNNEAQNSDFTKVDSEINTTIQNTENVRTVEYYYPENNNQETEIEEIVPETQTINSNTEDLTADSIEELQIEETSPISEIQEEEEFIEYPEVEELTENTVEDKNDEQVSELNETQTATDENIEESSEEYSDEEYSEEKFEDKEIADDDFDYGNEEDLETEKSEETEDSDADAEYSENEDEYNDEDYEDEDEDEEDENEDIVKPASKNKKIVLASVILLLLLACGGAFFLMKNINAVTSDTIANNPESQESVENNQIDNFFEQPNGEENNNEDNQNNENQNEEQNQTNNQEMTPPPAPDSEQQANAAGMVEIPGQGQQETPQPTPLTEKALTQNNQSNGDVSKVMSNVFATGSTNVTLKGINWQCAPHLFTDKEFKGYLQNLDNVLRQNLKKDILDATETPSTNEVAVKMAIDNNGNLLKSIVASSCGSEQIDNIVLQSINQSLETQKTQIISDDSKKADKYFIQVVIKI